MMGDQQPYSGLTLDKDEFEILNKIGKGCQGDVFNAINKRTGANYAIKVMNTSCMSLKERERLQSEIQSNFTVSSSCKFRYFPHFYGYWTTNTHAYLVFEKCEGNALEGLKLSRTPSRSYSFAYVLLFDILKGLEILQERNIIHRDLKPENILLDKGMFKVCDLGLSRVAKKGRRLTVDVGNVVSKSPQFYSGNYDCKTDVWSLGINTFWIAFGRLPFQQKMKNTLLKNSLADIIHKISHLQFKVNLGPLPTNLIEILKDMLKVDKNQRLTATQLLDKHFGVQGSLNDSLCVQKKILFSLYLRNRTDQSNSCNYYLILLLLLCDFTKMDDIPKSLEDEKEDVKRQLIRRIKINIYLFLKFIRQAIGQDEANHGIISVMEFYLERWELELESDKKNKYKTVKIFKDYHQALDLHKSRAISQKFPLLAEAVNVYGLMEQGKRVYLWDLPNLDLRKLKI